MNVKKPACLAAFLSALLMGLNAHAQVSGYYTAPSAHNDALVFSSEGDLWRVSRTGGTATRMTTHPEVETDAAISPDSGRVAFTAHYDGAREVYVMPLSGGKPRQVTFEGGGVRVIGWTPDGAVLYVSSNEAGPRVRVLRSVDPESLTVSTIPLRDARDASFGAEPTTLFFTRYGLALGNDNAVLYRGGRMAQLWRYDLDREDEATRLAADFGAPIRHPMWWQGRVYFVSDKSGADNIWSVNEQGDDARQHTDFEGWRLGAPSLADGVVTYQRGGDLYAYDIAADAETRLDIRLDSDRDFTRTRWLEEPLSYLETAHMAMDGKSAALTARGNAALAFPGVQRRIELPLPGDARMREARPGVKGEWIYAIVDQGQSGEIWRFPADGRGPGEALTQGSDARIWEFLQSPDGDRLIFDDKKGRLWSFEIGARRKQLLETNIDGGDAPFFGFTWSPGGRYLAYAASDQHGLNQVIIRDMRNGVRKAVSGAKYEAFAPAFSASGKWLYFISNRNFSASPSAPWGDRNTGPGFDQRGRIYAVQLTPGAQFPFEPKDELALNGDDAADDKDDADSAAKKDPAIVFDGLEERLWQAPVKADNFTTLKANAQFLYVLVRDGDSSALKSIAIDARDPEMSHIAGDVRSFDLSADRKTLFYRAGQGEAPTLALIPAAAIAPGDLSPHRLRVGDWRLAVNAAAEWRQQFLDAWRLHRDFAYDSNLRGVDWNAVREKYEPLTARLGHRSELNDLLGQMVSELGILHSQIGAGDQPDDAESGRTAFLGAVFEGRERGLEISLVYEGESDLPEQLGPLLKPGVDVRAGDIVTAVDGRPVRSHGDLTNALSHKAGQQVRLDMVRGRRAFSVIVKPVGAGEAYQLRYRHWVEMNRRKVQSSGDGAIGYLHLQAMGGRDMAGFVRDFYQHVDKDGLIIDVRANRGGNIDSFVIAILLRKVWAFWESALGGESSTNMQQTFRGHLAVLIDQDTYSDGETFAAGVKALELGPLIGVRTAGAGVWLTDRNRLSDNGIARIAEFPQSGLDGRWLIEGHGISPDIEVINVPRASYLGGDAQLQAGIDYLKEKIRSEPVPVLKAAPLPPLGENGRDIK